MAATSLWHGTCLKVYDTLFTHYQSPPPTTWHCYPPATGRGLCSLLNLKKVSTGASFQVRLLALISNEQLFTAMYEAKIKSRRKLVEIMLKTGKKLEVCAQSGLNLWILWKYQRNMKKLSNINHGWKVGKKS